MAQEAVGDLAATAVMAGPTPARNTGGGPNGLGPGLKNGVMTVWV
jgi:hypothetical protein